MEAAPGQSTARPAGAAPLRSLTGRHPWGLLLLVVPAVTVVVPPLYVRSAPHLIGIPFVVWYQFVVVAGGALLTLAARAVCFPSAADETQTGIPDGADDRRSSPLPAAPAAPAAPTRPARTRKPNQSTSATSP